MGFCSILSKRVFKGERTRVEPFAAEVTEDDKTITFATGKVTLVVEKDPINFMPIVQIANSNIERP